MFFLILEGGINLNGIFWCYGVILIVGGFWVVVFVFEMVGWLFESMDRFFELLWYKIGLFGNWDVEERDIVYNEKG